MNRFVLLALVLCAIPAPFRAADPAARAAMMAKIEGPQTPNRQDRVAAAYGWDSLDKPVLR